MAELVAIGAVVNILTLIDLTITAIIRIQAYTSLAFGIPSPLRDDLKCLPLLSSYLEQLRNHPAAAQQDVRAVVEGFGEVVLKLEEQIKTLMLARGESKLRRVW